MYKFQFSPEGQRNHNRCAEILLEKAKEEKYRARWGVPAVAPSVGWTDNRPMINKEQPHESARHG